MIEQLAKNFGMEFIEFRDDPSPSMIDTMKMFASARLVLGPHGAGFANLMYARTGTFLLEILCFQSKEGGSPGCYRSLCGDLGMPYVALKSDPPGFCSGPLSVDVLYLGKLVTSILKEMKPL